MKKRCRIGRRESRHWCRRTHSNFRAVDPRAVKIGFYAIDKSIGLEIDADGRADHKAGEAEIPGGTEARIVVWIGPIASAEAIARIGAEIESAPVVDLGNDSRYVSCRREWRRRCRRRQVRGKHLGRHLGRNGGR